MSELGDLTSKLFAQVLTRCDRQGLIGHEIFAIDGVKLPTNASKAKSGTRADYQHQLERMELEAQKTLDKHREADVAPKPERESEREARALARIEREDTKWRDWLDGVHLTPPGEYYRLPSLSHHFPIKYKVLQTWIEDPV